MCKTDILTSLNGMVKHKNMKQLPVEVDQFTRKLQDKPDLQSRLLHYWLVYLSTSLSNWEIWNLQNFQQLSLWAIPKFGSKNQKIFLTQIFGLDSNVVCLISFINKIFCSAWILHLPTAEFNECQFNHLEFKWKFSL